MARRAGSGRTIRKIIWPLSLGLRRRRWDREGLFAPSMELNDNGGRDGHFDRAFGTRSRSEPGTQGTPTRRKGFQRATPETKDIRQSAPAGPSEPRQPLIFVMLTKNERKERNRQLSDRRHRATRGLRPTHSLLCSHWWRGAGQRYEAPPLFATIHGIKRG
jgi:hypothetical protein